VRVAVATHTVAVAGGAESYLRNLVSLLAGAGFDVCVLTEDEKPASLEVSVLSLRSKDGLSSLARWQPEAILVNGLNSPRLERELIGRWPAALFAHNYYGTCISGAKRHLFPHLKVCERRFGFPCLALYYPRRCGGLSPDGFMADYLRQRERLRNLQSYRRVLVASAHMAAEFRNHTSRPVTIIPLFVSPAPASAAARDTLTIAFVGRLTREKGPDLLVHAASRLRAHGTEVDLVFVGDGPSRQELEKLVKVLKVPSRFSGWLAPSARDKVLERTCVLAMPSRWPEPFGLAGLEAGRLGIPTVAFEIGGIGDWLADGVNGRRIPVGGDQIGRFADAIQEAIDDARRDNQWGRGARRMAERFDGASHLSALSDVFAELRASPRTE